MSTAAIRSKRQFWPTRPRSPRRSPRVRPARRAPGARPSPASRRCVLRTLQKGSIDLVHGLPRDVPLVEHLERALARLASVLPMRRGAFCALRRFAGRSPRKHVHHRDGGAGRLGALVVAAPGPSAPGPALPSRTVSTPKPTGTPASRATAAEPRRRLAGDVLVVVGVAADHRAQRHHRVEAPRTRPPPGPPAAARRPPAPRRPRRPRARRPISASARSRARRRGRPRRAR